MKNWEILTSLKWFQLGAFNKSIRNQIVKEVNMLHFEQFSFE